MKDAKKHGVRIGNWLTAEDGKALKCTFNRSSLCGKRDYAVVAILRERRLRRAELAAAQVEDLQQRQEHWVFADLIGKSRHIRTVPKPHWVAEAVRRLVNRSWRLTEGGVFRAINKVARISPKGLSRKALELQL